MHGTGIALRVFPRLTRGFILAQHVLGSQPINDRSMISIFVASRCDSFDIVPVRGNGEVGLRFNPRPKSIIAILRACGIK